MAEVLKNHGKRLSITLKYVAPTDATLAHFTLEMHFLKFHPLASLNVIKII